MSGFIYLSFNFAIHNTTVKVWVQKHSSFVLYASKIFIVHALQVDDIPMVFIGIGFGSVHSNRAFPLGSSPSPTVILPSFQVSQNVWFSHHLTEFPSYCTFLSMLPLSVRLAMKLRCFPPLSRNTWYPPVPHLLNLGPRAMKISYHALFQKIRVSVFLALNPCFFRSMYVPYKPFPFSDWIGTTIR